MLTVGDMSTTDSATGILRRCLHCHTPVAWALTYLGRKLAFDPHPVPRKWDIDGTGWIPGRFPIDGKIRTAFAPLPIHPYDKRARVAHVMLLHHCPKAQAAA